MKRFYVIIVVMFFLTLGLFSTVEAAKWTFMVYLDGDNNLEGAAIDDFLEMATVGSNSDINIVVQFDRISGYDSSYGDWTACKRFYVTSGMTPTAANALQDLGECNMGDPATLTAFINWATTNYPADNYALILWNHGGGWREQEEALIKALKEAKTEEERVTIKRELTEIKKYFVFRAVCWDDTNGEDCLYMKEVKSALDAATVDMDLIGFDACLMGMIEVAYEIKDTGASVMVGSEETEPGDGWPYDTILSDLVSNPTWTSAQLGTCIVNRYYQSYGNSETQSAIDLTHIGTLASTVSNFADTMRTYWNTNQNAVKAAAQSVMDEVNTTVIHEQHGASWPGSHGLAIYFPATQGEFNTDYNGTIIDFAADTSWDEFLSDFYGSMGGSWIDRARNQSQEYYYNEHIDLYDFCEKLVNYVPPPEYYTETQVPHIFIGNGTAQGWTQDDQCWQYSLPFSFPFYGNTYTSIWICSNGYIDFVPEYSDGWSDFSNSTSELIQNVRIAPLWTDIWPNNIYIHQPSSDSVCIRWQGYEWWDRGSINIELVLYKDGRIRFNYGAGNTSIGAGWTGPPTIGISAGDGVNYDLSVYNGLDNLTNVDSILYTPVSQAKKPMPWLHLLLGD